MRQRRQRDLVDIIANQQKDIDRLKLALSRANRVIGIEMEHTPDDWTTAGGWEFPPWVSGDIVEESPTGSITTVADGIWTVPESGVYVMQFEVRYGTGATGDGRTIARILANSTTPGGGTTLTLTEQDTTYMASNPGIHAVAIAHLSAGDTVAASIYGEVGAAVINTKWLAYKVR